MIKAKSLISVIQNFNFKGPKLKSTRLPNNLSSISPHENLLSSSIEQYQEVGLQALNICKKILVGIEPKHIIDFPSGYGRVLRWFKHEWPNAKLTAVETDLVALNFVENYFGALPVLANAKMDFTLPLNADLIFSGSLLTHFDEYQWDKFFEISIKALSPTGTLIFSTHGRINALLAKINHPMYGDLVDLQELYNKYCHKEFSYHDYDSSSPGFGISLSMPSWVMRKLQAMPEVRIVFFEEGAWGQDIYAVKRNIEGPMIFT